MVAYAQAGVALTYKADFKVDGEFVHPSAASITVLKNDGSVADSINDAPLTVGTGATSAVYTISANANAMTLPSELRYVIVKFTYGGKPYQYQDIYNLRTNLLVPTTKQEVRNLVSMTETELPDDQIDLYFAYSQLNDDLDGSLGSLISTGSEYLSKIQVALAAKAAMNSCALLELMIYQSEQADNTIYRRFETIDFQELMGRLAGIYSAVVDLVLDVAADSVTIFIAATGTDPVTGA